MPNGDQVDFVHEVDVEGQRQQKLKDHHIEVMHKDQNMYLCEVIFFFGLNLFWCKDTIITSV